MAVRNPDKRKKVDRSHVVAQGGEDACGATKKGGGCCNRPAGWGTSHQGIGSCRIHGGRLPAQIRSRVVANAELSLLVDEPLEVDPAQGLLWCVSLSAQDVSWLNDRIAALEHWRIRPVSSEKGVQKGERTDLRKRGEAQLDGLIIERFRAEERLARFCKMALDAGVAERMVRLAEKMGDLLAPLLNGLMDDLGIDKDKARPFIEQRLRAIEGTSRLLGAA